MPSTTLAAATGLPAVLISVLRIEDTPANAPQCAEGMTMTVVPPLATDRGESLPVFPDFSRPSFRPVDPVETERATNAVLEAINAILAAEGGAHV